jgi:large subunit ribosomal protein L25
MAGPMEIAKARRLVSLLPPRLVNFFIRYPPRNPVVRTIYSPDDGSHKIARLLHDFESVPESLYKPTFTTTHSSTGEPVETAILPFQNPFKPVRDARSGRFHGPRYSLRQQADIIKLAMRYGVAELLPPSDKMDKLMYGKKRPMQGTLRPKRTYEERTRTEYVAKKQKGTQDALRLVAMRQMVHIRFIPTLISSGDN